MRLFHRRGKYDATARPVGDSALPYTLPRPSDENRTNDDDIDGNGIISGTDVCLEYRVVPHRPCARPGTRRPEQGRNASHIHGL